MEKINDVVYVAEDGKKFLTIEECKAYGNKCEWWDYGYPECMLPWANKNENGCNGNPFICKKTLP